MRNLHSTTTQPQGGAVGAINQVSAAPLPVVERPLRWFRIGLLLVAVMGLAAVAPAAMHTGSISWATFGLVALAAGATMLAAAVVTGPAPTTAPNRSERVLRALVAGPPVGLLLVVSATRLHDGAGVQPRNGLIILMFTACLVVLSLSPPVTPSFAGPSQTEGVPFPPVCRAFKRMLDVTIAGMAVVATLPVIAASAVVIKCTSRGPWLFRQVRIGTAGRPFTVLKLRTMYEDNDASEHRAYVAALIKGHADATDAGMFKLTTDPRVTPVGRWLRGLSIDELPQLFNVLRGDMSLVGPRPPLPDEAVLYDEEARQRLAAKPGMTGLWQVSGRSRLTFAEMVDLDVRYWKEWTPLLELHILVRTPRVAFMTKDTA